MSLDQPSLDPERDNGPDDAKPTPPKKPGVNVTRIVLFLILLAAVAAGGYDWLMRYQVGQAAARLEELDNKQEEAAILDLSPEVVQRELQRQPDSVTEKVNDRGMNVSIEHYNFGGVFYQHRLNVTYQKRSFMIGVDTESVFRLGGEPAE
jgi:hypothetical protein